MRQKSWWTLAAALLIIPFLSGCILDDRDPTKVNGQIKLTITTNATKVKVGDRVAFLATLANKGDKPVNVPLGWSFSGVCFVNGSVMRAAPDAAPIKGAVKEEKPQWKVGFCGTGAYPLVVVVPGKGKLEYTMNAIVKEDKQGLYLNFGAANHDFLILRLPKEGKVNIHAEHEAKPHKGPFPPVGMDKNYIPPRNVAQGWAPDPDAPVWSGKMSSNKVSLQIVK